MPPLFCNCPLWVLNLGFNLPSSGCTAAALCPPPRVLSCGFDLSLVESTAAALYPKTHLTEMIGLRNRMNKMKTAESYNGRFNQANEKT